MAEAREYRGGCHCGRVRFRVQADLSGELVTCNCSLCSRMGWALAFVPGSLFELESGQEALTDYQFNKKQLHHLFCATCGVRSFSRGPGHDGGETYAINVRCLEGDDGGELKLKLFDGRSL